MSATGIARVVFAPIVAPVRAGVGSLVDRRIRLENNRTALRRTSFPALTA